MAELPVLEQGNEHVLAGAAEQRDRGESPARGGRGAQASDLASCPHDQFSGRSEPQVGGWQS